jgi:hypothetical protein
VTGNVVTGQTATFDFDVVAPEMPGTYDFQWKMVDDDVAWFGAPTPKLQVVVTPALAFASGPISFAAGSLPYWQTVIGDANGDGFIEPFGTINDGAGNLSAVAPASVGLGDLLTLTRPNDFRVADLNGDGCEDLVVEGYSAHASASAPDDRALLYFNDGTGRFVEDPAFASLELTGRGEGLIVADFNNDGATDIYLPFYTFGQWDGSCFPSDECPNAPRSNLLLNDGAGHFIEGDEPGSVDLAVYPGGQPEGVQAVDINDDGLIDLYVSGHLFINRGLDSEGHVVFSDCRCGIQASPVGMLVDEGAKFVDWNNDGLLDLVLNDPYTGPKLYENAGTRTKPTFHVISTRGDGVSPIFAQKTTVGGAVSYTVPGYCASYGMNAYDLDNDGFEDIVVTGSPAGGSAGCDFPNYVFRNTGVGFESIVVPPVSGNRMGGVFGFGDMNGDGRIDVQFVGPSPYYFTNVTPGIGSRAFTVDVRGPNGERNEFGRVARIDLPKPGCTRGAPGCTLTRVVDGGSGYHAQNQYPILVGTPYSGTHSIEVVLPAAGEPTRTVSVFASASPGEYVEILAPSPQYPAGRVLYPFGAPAGTCRAH